MNRDRVSFMTMALLRDTMLRRVKFDHLGALLRSRGLVQLDLVDLEIKLFGARTVSRAMEKNGLALSSLIAGVPIVTKSPQDVAKHVRRAIATAERFGAPRIMIVPTDEVTAGRALRRLTAGEKVDRYIAGFAVAVEEAGGHGIEIVLEDTPSIAPAPSTASECGAVLDGVPGLGLVFDTANMLVGGDDPLAFYEALKDRISYVHLKDVVLADEGRGDLTVSGKRMRSAVWGEGVVPLDAIVQRLEQDGYSGSVMMEYCAPAGKGTFDGHRDQIDRFFAYGDSKRWFGSA